MASALTAIVCSYRRPRNLAGCLQSLTEQSLSDLGILVVGVRGDTQTVQTASDLGIDVILQEAAANPTESLRREILGLTIQKHHLSRFWTTMHEHDKGGP